MGKKIEPDIIEWILKLNADDAQKKYADLTKSNQDLTREIKQRRKSMIELEAQGKKESDEYKQASKALKEKTKELEENKNAQSQLARHIGISGMTMNQLKKRARELKLQLDNTSKAADPESYARLENHLGEVKERMGELRYNGKNVEAQLEKIGMVAKGAAIVGVAALGYALKEIAVKSFETRKEFAKFEAILANTFQSQEKGEEAFAMLKDYAKETPYQLNQITETYIKLINRGIKPTKDELIKMGDLSAALGKDLDQLVEAQLDAMTGEFERLKEFGIKASKEGDVVKFTFKGVTTEVKNTDTAIKNYILSLGSLKGVQGSMAVQMDQLEGLQSNWNDTLDRLYNNLGKKLEPTLKRVFGKAISLGGELADSLDTVSDKYKVQMNRVTDLEISMPKLLDRYDQLKSKTNLSKEEHEELNTVIQSIGNIVPGAITQWDAYGRAIGLNTDKIYEFMAAERARLKYLNKDLIKETKKDIEDAQAEMQTLKKRMAEGGQYKTYGSGISQGSVLVPYSQEELAEVNDRIRELGDIILGGESQLKELTGQSLEDQVKTQMKSRKAREDFNDMTQAQLTQYIEMHKDAKDKYVELAKEIYESKFGNQTDGGGNITTEMKDSLKAVDLYIATEQNKAKQAYLSGEISKTEYLKRMEDLELESLRKKLDIYGLDAETQTKLMASVLDFALKTKEQMPVLLADVSGSLNNLSKDEKEDPVKQKKQENKLLIREEQSMNNKMKAILAQRDQQDTESLNRRMAKAKQYEDLASNTAGQMGEILGGFIGDSETAAADFQYNMLMMALDTLRQMVLIFCGELFGRMVSKYGPVKGGIIAAAGTALINGVFAGIKGSIKRPSTNLSSNEVNNGVRVNEGSRVVDGRYAGGYFTRAQDGREFYAGVDPDRRGYIDAPTVLVGESGREWVASNDAVSNPTIRPFIDLLDSAQRKGTIRTLDFSNVVVQGRQSGGYFESKQSSSGTGVALDGDLTNAIGKLIKVMDKPQRSYVVYKDIKDREDLLNRSINNFRKK